MRMIRKLRSRHPVDLPYDGFGRKKGILFVLGSLLALFVLIPLALALYGGLTEDGALDVSTGVAIAAAVGALLVVLAFAGLRGKVGWQR